MRSTSFTSERTDHRVLGVSLKSLDGTIIGPGNLAVERWDTAKAKDPLMQKIFEDATAGTPFPASPRYLEPAS